jgi:hypothetical protein
MQTTPTTTSIAATIIPSTITVGDLQHIAAELNARFPAAGPRIDRGLSLALTGHVERSIAGFWVRSERLEREYFVQATAQLSCGCQDWERRRDEIGACKHILSCLAVLAAERLDAERHDPTPDPEPPNCPRCNGSRRYWRTTDRPGEPELIDCPVCGGSGSRPDPEPPTAALVSEPAPQPACCPRCRQPISLRVDALAVAEGRVCHTCTVRDLCGEVE